MRSRVYWRKRCRDAELFAVELIFLRREYEDMVLALVPEARGNPLFVHHHDQGLAHEQAYLARVADEWGVAW